MHVGHSLWRNQDKIVLVCIEHRWIARNATANRLQTKSKRP